MPDTTEKKAQQKEVKKEKVTRKVIEDGEVRELTEQEKKEIQEVEAAIEKEMKAAQKQIEEEMKAVEKQIQQQYVAQETYRKVMEEYNQAVQEAMKDSQYDRQEYLEEMEKALQEYQEAMKDAQIEYRGFDQWTVPRQNYRKGYFYSDDSTTWTYSSPDNYHLFADSISDLVWDQYEDKLTEVYELEKLHEGQWVEMEDELMDLEDFYFEMPEMPEMPEYDFDYDFDYNFEIAEHSDPIRTKRIITTELREDDLIEYGREYVVVIDKKQMLINGEKQTRTVFKKYRRLVDSMESQWNYGRDEYKIFIGH